jgi:hypothetical protein
MPFHSMAPCHPVALPALSVTAGSVGRAAGVGLVEFGWGRWGLLLAGWLIGVSGGTYGYGTSLALVWSGLAGWPASRLGTAGFLITVVAGLGWTKWHACIVVVVVVIVVGLSSRFVDC